ncbi:MAG: hypothetical protein KAT16_02325 [Candidatus Heimdallarchaeota archaeon]|nr:hypothetical protein [Candidatus Heimdallarchaeota archaeon]
MDVNLTNEELVIQKTKKRTLGDNLRQLKFNLTAARADLKYLRRVVFREMRFFINFKDLLILFLLLLFIAVIVITFTLFLLPIPLAIISNKDYNTVHKLILEFIEKYDLFRLLAALIGVVTIVIRLMVQSPINNYRDKVNSRKNVTYVFGSSKPAEQFLFEMIHQYGYEEQVSLVADTDLLWIRKLKSLIDIYVVEDLKEFEKPNLYEIIGFKNASRILILSESIELNQNILTNIRQVRPDVEIVLLSQYAPNFVFSDLVQDENLVIIEDLDVTVEGLVLSLSLDFRFPQTSEIDVPRTYVDNTGDEMSSDIPKLEVLLIRRGDELLPSSEKLQHGDRIIVYYYSNFDMKRTNRVVTELSYKKKKKKETTESKSTGMTSIPETKLNEEELSNSPPKSSAEEDNLEEI